MGDTETFRNLGEPRHRRDLIRRTGSSSTVRSSHGCAGRSHEQPIEVGDRDVDVRIDWTGSGAFGFSVEPGELADFVCRPGGLPIEGARQ